MSLPDVLGYWGMQIEIHDVDHGSCVVITGPRGHRLMLDCGQSLSRPWFPSITFGGQVINTLLLMNLDEDHVEDLEDLWKSTKIMALGSNPTVSASALKFMKTSGMRRGVTAAHNILSAFGPGFHGQWWGDLGGVHWHAFWNKYGTDFLDTNNLSLAVFVKYGPFTGLFGGDLETAGWKKLLWIPAFRARLLEVNLFVASHHGRESGKCEELFQWCAPDLIVFSDGPKEHETQETTDWYYRRAKRIPDWSQPVGLFGPPRRHVMTTRNDGTIHIDIDENGRWNVTGNSRQNSLVEGLSALGLLQPPFPRNLLG
jgi:beta-lactamase superfamily II metal-dependent hydrolase